MELQLKYFVLFFPCTCRIKLLNTSKTKSFFWQVTFHIFLDIGRDDQDDYDDGESIDEDCYEEHDDEKHALIR